MGWPRIYIWRKQFSKRSKQYIHSSNLRWSKLFPELTLIGYLLGWGKVLGLEHPRRKPECLQVTEGERQGYCMVQQHLKC